MMSSKSRMKLIILFPLFLLSFIEVKAYRPQEIILYTGVNYSGRQKSFYSTQLDLKSDSVGKIAKSHCVVRGLWRVSGSPSSRSSLIHIENIYSNEKSGKVCGNDWNSQNQSTEYKSIRLIGSEDLDTPAINFHVKPRFYSNEELYFDGRVLRLPKPQNFSSFGFTGRHNWTIFRNTELTGPSECLVANLDSNGDYGVTFEFSRDITVGSIWRGCGLLNLYRGEPDKDKNFGNRNKSVGLLISIIALLSKVGVYYITNGL